MSILVLLTLPRLGLLWRAALPVLLLSFSSCPFPASVLQNAPSLHQAGFAGTWKKVAASVRTPLTVIRESSMNHRVSYLNDTTNVILKFLYSM